ncbi:PAS domain S-box protein [Haloarcula sp. K1]|uniref:PAS domain S-box protein n=1 Tax=Haloarcula sp. K1 TaxID=1622207 RepID=UPI0007BB195F|nr:PAS domain S-box protein [Haloarcula sp. K1]KZX46206.1 hypothetical protein AV929_15650 [Haloarcula sp. K1]
MVQFHAPTDTGQGKSPSQQQTTVLLVDDEPDFLSLAKSELEDQIEETKFITASSVRKAHFRLSELDISCIVSDYDMPAKSGLQFLEEVREDHPNLPFILFTAQGSENLASKAISAGVTDYLQKRDGGQFDILANRVINAVKQYQAEQTQKKLAETASRLRAVVNSTPDSIFIIDSAGAIVDVNEQAEKTLQYNHSELVGKPLSSVITSREINDSIPDVIGSRSRVRFEGHHTRRRGSKYPVEVRIKEIDHADTDQYIVIAQDITSQKKHKQTIDELNETAMALMQSRSKEEVAEITVQTAREELTIPFIGIWFQDDKHDVLTPVKQTGKAEETLGAQSEIPLEGAVADVWGEKEPCIFEGIQTPETRYPEDVSVEDEMLFPLGEFGMMIVSVTDSRLYREEDINLAKLLATNAQRALKQTDREEQVRAEKMFFDAAINTVEDLFFAIDENENLIRWNDQVSAVTGNEATYIGSPTLDDIFNSEDRGKITHGINEGFETGGSRVKATIQTVEGPQTFEFKSSKMDYPINDETYLITLGRNITPLEEKQAELRQKNERLDKFSRVVSHDLQSPINIASGNFGIVRDDISDEHARNAEAVENAHSRMENLVNDLLTLARQGQQAIEIESVSLDRLARKCWEIVDASDADLEVRSSENIQADPSQLQQLLENLMKNAVTHGGNDITVTIGTLEDGFYVEDNGSGIPGDKMDHIFDTGFTTSDSGSGIGLMIVSDIAENHSWGINVTESDSGGARFEFTESP